MEPILFLKAFSVQIFGRMNEFNTFLLLNYFFFAVNFRPSICDGNQQPNRLTVKSAYIGR